MKIFKLIRNIFLFVGVAFLCTALFIFFHTQSFLRHSATAQGIVVANIPSSDSNTFRPKVVFQTSDGQFVTFFSSVGTNPPSFGEGDKVTILYDPQQPHNAKIRSFAQLWLGSILFGILGTVFAGIGCGILWFSNRKKGLQKTLQQSGQCITAQITDVGLNPSLTMNGRNPFRIVSQWQDPSTSRVYVFNSDNIWFDPAQWIPQNKAISVWIDPNNPSRYSVDTSFLPPTGNES